MIRKISVMLICAIIFTTLCGCNNEKGNVVESSFHSEISGGSVVSPQSDKQEDSETIYSDSLHNDREYIHPEFMLVMEDSKGTNKKYNQSATSQKEYSVKITHKHWDDINTKEYRGEAAWDLLKYIDNAKELKESGSPTDDNGKPLEESYNQNLYMLSTTSGDYCLYFSHGIIYHKQSEKQFELIEEFETVFRKIYNYYPYNCYLGNYEDGILTLVHSFAAESDVAMEVKDIYAIGDGGDNWIELELRSSKTQRVQVKLECDPYSSEEEFVKTEYINLKANKSSRITLNFPECMEVKITAGNTLFEINIEYGGFTTKQHLKVALKENPDYVHPQFRLDMSNNVPTNKVYKVNDDENRTLNNWKVEITKREHMRTSTRRVGGEIGDDFVRLLKSATILSDGTAPDYKHLPYGAYIFKTKTDSYYIDPETHTLYHNEGKTILEMSNEFSQLLTDIWYYYPTNSYYGRYQDGVLSLEHKYKSETSVDIQVKDIYAFSDRNYGNNLKNYAVLEVSSKEDKVVTIGASCRASDDCIGSAESRKIFLEANKPQEVILWFTYGHIWRVSAGNNSIEIVVDFND